MSTLPLLASSTASSWLWLIPAVVILLLLIFFGRSASRARVAGGVSDKGRPDVTADNHVQDPDIGPHDRPKDIR